MTKNEATISVAEMLYELEHIHICMNELTESMEEMSAWLRSLKSTDSASDTIKYCRERSQDPDLVRQHLKERMEKGEILL